MTVAWVIGSVPRSQTAVRSRSGCTAITAYLTRGRPAAGGHWRAKLLDDGASEVTTAKAYRKTEIDRLRPAVSQSQVPADLGT